MKTEFRSQLLLLALALFALVCAGCPDEKVTVPAVGEMTLAAAQAAIEGAGLTLGAVTYASSETVAAGAVISQDPAAGAKVDEGTAVSLVVSTGPEPVGRVIGWVHDAAGTPLPDVLVELDEPTKTGISSTMTNVDGLYSLDDLAPQDGLVLRFSREGHTPNSQYVDIIDDVTTSANCVLLPLAAPVAMDAAAGGEVQDWTTGAKLTIPENAFVTAKGAVTGEVTVQMTPLDITDPSQLTAFPGNYRAVEIGAKNGETVTLETFGLVDIRVTQDLGKSTETEVQLAEGKTAMIEIPLQPDVPVKEYENMLLWWFNPDTGIWEQEALTANSGVKPASSGVGMSFYAEIGHFSWWNCDQPLSDKACIRGRVVDEQDNPIAGAEVEARGVSYDGSTKGTTNATGEFCLNVKGGSDVEILITLPAASIAVITLPVTAGPAGDSCAETGICTDLGDITAAWNSCVHGLVRNADGQPVAGVDVYSSAGTTDVTDANGEFCVNVPGGYSVSVWCFGGTSVQVTTPETGDCPAGCAEVELTTVRVYDGADVGTIVSSSFSQCNYWGCTDYAVLSARFATVPSDDVMMTLGYLGHYGFGYSYGRHLESLVGNMEDYVVFDTGNAYYGAIFGCDVVEDDYQSLLDCLVGNLGQVSALDAGAPGLAEFSPEQSPDMTRLWDIFDALGYLKGAAEGDVLTRLKALSYGQFISAGWMYGLEGAPIEPSDAPVDVSWPGGTNIGAFTATVPGVPVNPVFTYPAFGGTTYDTTWWFDSSSDVTLTWEPQDPSLSLKIQFSAYNDVAWGEEGDLFTILVWAQDDGSFTIPASAFANMPSDARIQQITAIRLALDTASVPLAEQAGNGQVLLESHSGLVSAMSRSDDFVLSWQPSAIKVANNGPAKAAPANDNLADAQLLTGASGSVSGTLKEATLETFEAQIFGGGTPRTVWYTWTAPADGNYDFRLDNDHYIGFFYGDPTTEISYSGWWGGGIFSVTGGVEYKIAVWNYAYDKANSEPPANAFPFGIK